MPNPTQLRSLERAIGVTFRDTNLLAQALTHRSAVSDGSSPRADNERLEFLGDAVLELVVTDHLYHTSDKPEGELTSFRSALVNGEQLALIARELGLGAYLYFSRGEEASGGREKPSALANALEALIGAIYLDQDFDAARAFIEQFILKHLHTLVRRGLHRDPKSRFQEVSQEKLGITPSYEVVEAEGPDHEKQFTVVCLLGTEKVATGTGMSKQRAELDAAERALKRKGWM